MNLRNLIIFTFFNLITQLLAINILYAYDDLKLHKLPVVQHVNSIQDLVEDLEGNKLIFCKCKTN